LTYDEVTPPIIGLPSELYQGQTVNVSIPIYSDRANNITLNVSLIADGIQNVINKEVNFTTKDGTLVLFNITADIDTTPGILDINLKITRGNITYLDLSLENKEIPLNILNALDYSNLIFASKVVKGDDIKVSLNLKNYLPDDPQSCNITFEGDYIQTFFDENITLNPSETRTISYNLIVSENVFEATISIDLTISKGNKSFYTDTFTVNIVPKLELVSITFSEQVPQGELAYLIIVINNNEDTAEDFLLYINGERVDAVNAINGEKIGALGSGLNKIIKEVLPTINPYEFGTKKYQIKLENSQGEIILIDYFEITLTISTFNLVMFYILPILIPISIIIFYKNKDLKNKLLRR
jgi:hypothetical protein